MNRITVVIPTLLKNKEVLNKLLKNIDQDNAVSEIILIDNSCQGFESKFEKVRTIKPKQNLFVNPSWNLGIKEAKEKYVALVNDDLLVCQNFFTKCMDVIGKTEKFGCLGMASESVINIQSSEYPKETEFSFEAENDINNRPVNWGTIIILDKTLFQPINEKIKIWCGDDYIRWIMHEQKYNVYKLTNAVIYHLGSLSSSNPALFEMEINDILEYAAINEDFKNNPLCKGAIDVRKGQNRGRCSKIFSLFYKKKVKGGKTTWKVFGLPIWKTRYIEQTQTKKYYLLNILVWKSCYFCGQMKLGVSYNLFDGEELLESSIKSIRSEVDYINVVYQKKSYFGTPARFDIEDYLKNLQNKKLIDEIYLYDRDFEDSNKHEYEREKRDIGLHLARKRGCTHFLSMDVDEFYDVNQLKYAKQYITQNGIEASAVSIFEYLKEPIYRMIDSYTFTGHSDKIYNFYCPFIMKITPKTKRHQCGNFPCLVDPTRGLNGNGKFYLFSKQDVVMHHMSTVRKNLAQKYNNSNLNLNILWQQKIRDIQNKILKWNFEDNKLNDKFAIFDNDKIIEKVEDIFHVKYK